MALKLIVDTLEGIPEAQQTLYAKGEDGKFKLDVEGIEDTSGLKKALQAEREAAAKAREALKAYDGVDLEELRKLQQAVESSEEAKLLRDAIGDAEKLTKLRTRWTEQVTRAEEKKRAKLEEENKALVEAERKKNVRWRTQVLDNALREAAEKAGVHSQAIEDVLMHGRVLFTIDEEGNAVQLDKEGKQVFGLKGPLMPAEWLENVREAKPHWFPASGAGSGAQQGAGGNSSGKSMKRAVFDKLSPLDKRKTLKDGVTVVD